MKSIFVLILILVTSYSTAQGGLFDNKVDALITLNTGDTISCRAELISRSRIKLKRTDSSEVEKLHFKNVKNIVFYTENNDTIKYVYLKIKDKKRPQVLSEKVIGKRVNLYTSQTAAYLSNFKPAFDHTGNSFSVTHYGGTVDYYVKRTEEKEVTYLCSNAVLARKSYHKEVKMFLRDCSDLFYKIENKEINKKDIEAIVEYYNTSCGK